MLKADDPTEYIRNQCLKMCHYL